MHFPATSHGFNGKQKDTCDHSKPYNFDAGLAINRWKKTVLKSKKLKLSIITDQKCLENPLVFHDQPQLSIKQPSIERHSSIKFSSTIIYLTLCTPRSAHRSRGKSVALAARRGSQAGTQQDGGQHAQHIADKIDLGPRPTLDITSEARRFQLEPAGSKLGGAPKDLSPDSINSRLRDPSTQVNICHIQHDTLLQSLG